MAGIKDRLLGNCKVYVNVDDEGNESLDMDKLTQFFHRVP